jgi:hypothetical protein
MDHSSQLPLRALAAVSLVVIFMSLGTLVYYFLEGWSFIDSLYFTTITITTIGYGDIAPTNPVSKLFTVLFAFSGVTIFLFSMTVIAEHYFSKKVMVLEKQVKSVSFQAQKAINMLGNGNAGQERISGRDFVKEMVIEHRQKKSPRKGRFQGQNEIKQSYNR